MCKNQSGKMSKTCGDNSQGHPTERPTSQASHMIEPDSHTISTSTCGCSCETYPFLPSNVNPVCGSDSQTMASARDESLQFAKNLPRSHSSYQNNDSYHSAPGRQAIYQNQNRYSVVNNGRQSNYQDPGSYPFPSKIQDSFPNQSCYSYMENNYNQPNSYGSGRNPQDNQQGYLDSDDETEQSPMLAQEQYKQGWNPNIVHEETYNILPPSPFANSYIYPSGKEVANCDNLSSYQHFKIQNTFQTPPSYDEKSTHFGTDTGEYFDNFEGSPVADLRRHTNSTKKKWLLNQKCKSADSEPDSIGSYPSSSCWPGLSFVSHNYNAGIPNAGVLYAKPPYAYNGDPIPGPSGLQRPCSINWETTLNPGDQEFRSRSYSLTPTVNFAVFESESSSDTEDVPESKLSLKENEISPQIELQVKTIEDSFELLAGKSLPVSPSAAQLSIASSYGDNGSPICKICHTTGKELDPLISPCLCSGTMQYIHAGCLQKWLDVSNKKLRKQQTSCELCQYEYQWRKKFKFKGFPECSQKDKILHTIFFMSIILMIASVTTSVMLFKQDRGTRVDLEHNALSGIETANLACGVVFFVSFFLSIYVEAKAQATLLFLVKRFRENNEQWYINEYKKDNAPVAV